MLTLRLGELPLRFAEAWFSLGRPITMSIAKRNHITPRMYLAPFAIPARPGFVFQKMLGQEIQVVSIRNASVIKGFYAPDTEAKLASIESDAKSVIDQCLQEQTLTGIGFDSRAMLAKYMHVSEFRTPHFLNETMEGIKEGRLISEVARDLMQTLESKGVDIKQSLAAEAYKRDIVSGHAHSKGVSVDARTYSDVYELAEAIVAKHAEYLSTTEYVFNDVLRSGIPDEERIVEVIARSAWVLFQSGEGIEFITSNNFVWRSEGIAQDDFQMFMPISPSFGIYISRYNPNDGHLARRVSNQWVRQINDSLFVQSGILFGSNSKILETTASRRWKLPKPVTPFPKGRFVPCLEWRK